MIHARLDLSRLRDIGRITAFDQTTECRSLA